MARLPLAILQGEPGAQGGTAPLLAYQAASGRLAWRAAMSAFVQVPTVLVPDGILVQPADPGTPAPPLSKPGSSYLRSGAGGTPAGRA